MNKYWWAQLMFIPKLIHDVGKELYINCLSACIVNFLYIALFLSPRLRAYVPKFIVALELLTWILVTSFVTALCCVGFDFQLYLETLKYVDHTTIDRLYMDMFNMTLNNMNK